MIVERYVEQYKMFKGWDKIIVSQPITLDVVPSSTPLTIKISENNEFVVLYKVTGRIEPGTTQLFRIQEAVVNKTVLDTHVVMHYNPLPSPRYSVFSDTVYVFQNNAVIVPLILNVNDKLALEYVIVQKYIPITEC